MIYFDYAASTPLNKEVLDVFYKLSLELTPNASSHTKSQLLNKQAGDIILDTLNLKNHEITFTSGGAEANNLAIRGYLKTKRKGHLITSIYEHSSVYNVFVVLEQQGYEVTYLTPNSDGVIEVSDVINNIKDNTILVSIMTVNNEIGSVNDITSIAHEVKKVNKDICMMSDYVQGLGKIKLTDLSEIDLLTISAHKINGLKAHGAVIHNKELKQITYAGNPNDTRPGTSSVANNVAFAKAVKLTYTNYDVKLKQLSDIREYLTKKLSEISEVQINFTPVTNVISIYINSLMLSESGVALLKKRDIYLSTKSACSVKLKDVNRSLDFKYDKEINKKTYRISFSYLTTYNECDQLVDGIRDICENNIN